METTKQDKGEAASTTPDALAFLKAEHRTVGRLFTPFEKTDDVGSKAALAQRACEELSIHTMIEEELLYPAAQEALPDSDRVDVEEA